MSEELIPASRLGKAILDPLNHAIAAGARQALKNGVATHEVVEMMLNALASVVAMVEPPQAREHLTRDIVGALAGLVRQHVDVRYTTPGGIKLPGAGA